MSQNDFNIANQGFPSFRSDLNSALQALASNSAGTSAPATTYAYMWWYDSTNNTLKMRNADNDAWIDFASFDQATDTFTITTDNIDGLTATAAELNKLDGVTNDAASYFAASGALSNRNLIINGAMQVAQRGTSFAGWTGTAAYALDRWKYTNYQSGTVTVSQDSDAPVGFSKSLKIATTATDSGASTYSFLQQFIEGQDVASLAYGTASPKQITVSFWIKSNMTGTYTFNISSNDSARRIASTYTVDSADTWEHKTITFDGDSSSVIAYDNTIGLICEWWFAAGSNFTTNPLPTSWATNSNLSRSTGITVGINTSTSNYVNITGVQLEVGDTATPFEHRSYGQELALCQRYYQKFGGDSTFDVLAIGGIGQGGSGTTIQAITPFKGNMRTRPSATFFDIQIADATNAAIDVTGISLSTTISSTKAAMITYTVAGGVTQYRPYYVRVSSNTGGYLSFDAEL